MGKCTIFFQWMFFTIKMLSHNRENKTLQKKIKSKSFFLGIYINPLLSIFQSY